MHSHGSVSIYILTIQMKVDLIKMLNYGLNNLKTFISLVLKTYQ